MNDFFQIAGREIDGRYRIERVVAEGGFGVVYRAIDRKFGKAVALKVLKVPDTLSAEMKRTFVQQFQNEAAIISRLEHPAIVRVTDHGVAILDGGAEAPWMVLEWVDGPTLADELADRRERGGRTPREVFDLFGPVLEALAVAHTCGVVHRDLKPRNLMLPTPDAAHAGLPGRLSLHAAPRMRVLDFGIAKVLEGAEGPGSGHTRTSSTMPAYSPPYAAPEQLMGTRTGPWTDVHALGLIVTELLVDRRPYTGETVEELGIQVMSHVRPTPGRFGIDVGAWEPVLARSMALRAQERFANAGELLAALEAQLPRAHPGGGVAPAAPDPATGLPQPKPLPEVHPMRRPSKRLGRGLWIAGAGALGGLLLIVFGFNKMNSGAPRTDGRALVQAPVAPVVTPPVAPLVTPEQPNLAVAQPVPGTPATPEASPPAPPAPEAPVAAPPEAPVAAPPTPASSEQTPVRQTLETPRERRAREAREREAERAARETRTNAVRPPAPPPVTAAPSPPLPSSGGDVILLTPMERVSQCRRAGGDESTRNTCIINALRDRASSDQELRILATTYQVAGRTQDAVRTMRTYIQNFPQGSMANTFNQYILRNGY